MRHKLSVIAIYLLLGVCGSRAASIIVTNFSFENMTASLSTPTFAGLTIAGTNTTMFGAWTVMNGDSVIGLGPSIVSAGTGVSLGGPAPTDGTFDVKIGLAAGVGTSINLSQTLSASFQPNTSYIFSIDLDVGANVSLLASASLQLKAGNSNVVSLSNSSLVSVMDTTSGFQTISLNYTTGSSAPSGNIGIAFNLNSVVGLGGNIYLDNIKLTSTAAPEPGPLALGGIALLAWGVLRKRSR